MPISPADPAAIVRDDRAGRWAPWWVLAYVAMWPLPGIAETVLGLGALYAAVRMVMRRLQRRPHGGDDHGRPAAVALGDGDGAVFTGFTGSISVIAHELGHGVVEHSGGLDYQGQSGALNESIADVFGALTQPENADIIGFSWFNMAVTTISGGERVTNDWRIESRADSLAAFHTGIANPQANFRLIPY